MTPTELCFASVVELGRLIRTSRLSPVELCDAVLARVERLNGRLSAFLTVTPDLARAQARAAEARARTATLRGPLDGIPYSLKDLEPTAEVRTTFGSKWFADHVPAESGLVATRLAATGAVLLGKTNTPQFGHKDSCDNLLGPPCRNPWRLDRTSGGSSGGAASAVAAGLGPIAHGTDGGGSVRIPAALCGVVGMKPSFGRVPQYPAADYWSARNHHGVLARTVRDAALGLDAMAGPDPRDPLSIDRPPAPFLAACDGDLHDLTVVWSADFGYVPVDPEVRGIAEAAAVRFGELGARIEARDPGWPDPGAFHKVLCDVANAARHAERAAQRPEWIEPSLMQMVEDGRRVSGIDHARASVERSVFYDQAHRFFETCDLLVTPQQPVGAWCADPGPGPAPGPDHDRRPGHPKHLRPSWIHVPVQPHRTPGDQRPLWLHRPGPARRAPDRRTVAGGRARAASGRGVRGPPALGEPPPTT